MSLPGLPVPFVEHRGRPGFRLFLFHQSEGAPNACCIRSPRYDPRFCSRMNALEPQPSDDRHAEPPKGASGWSRASDSEADKQAQMHQPAKERDAGAGLWKERPVRQDESDEGYHQCPRECPPLLSHIHAQADFAKSDEYGRHQAPDESEEDDVPQCSTKYRPKRF